MAVKKKTFKEIIAPKQDPFTELANKPPTPVKTQTENNNPPMEISATNFFNIRFYPRIKAEKNIALTTRQLKLYQMLQGRVSGRSIPVLLPEQV